MGVAGAVVQLQHAVVRHRAVVEIHHGQIARWDGGALQHLLKDDACNSARYIDKIVVVRHLGRKGGIRQETAVFDLVAGKGFFQHGGEIFKKVGIHVHRTVGQHRLRRAGVQQVQDDLVDRNFHWERSFIWHRY